MKFPKIIVVIIALLLATPLFAQNAPTGKPADKGQILLEKIKADKKFIVSQNMDLTQTEANGFWPIYEDYQKDLQAINRRMAMMIKSYADAWNTNSIDNEKAKKMISEMLAIQTDEVNLTKTYIPRLSKVLPATKVARYLQIENKIRAMIKNELAEQIPLIPGN